MKIKDENTQEVPDYPPLVRENDIPYMDDFDDSGLERFYEKEIEDAQYH